MGGFLMNRVVPSGIWAAARKDKECRPMWHTNPVYSMQQELNIPSFWEVNVGGDAMT